MLLSNIWTRSISSPNIYKDVAEIILDSRGDSKFSDKLSDSLFNARIPGKDQLREFLINNNYKGSIDEIINDVNNYLLEYGTSNLYSDYIRGKRMRGILSDKLAGKSKYYDFDKVLDMCVEFFLHSPAAKYEDDVDNMSLAKWMTHTFSKFFINNDSDEIFKIINEQGMRVSSGDEELSLDDLAEVRINEDYSDFKYQNDMELIYNASRILFYNKKNKVYFSDMYTAIKDIELNKSMSDLAADIASVFCPGGISSKGKKFAMSSGYFPSITISGVNDELNSEYKVKTYTFRVELIKALMDYKGTQIQYKDLEILHKNFFNSDFITNTNNISKLYKYDEGVDAEVNKTITFDIIKGFLAVRRLKIYCLVNHIDFYSLPNCLFRYDNYYKCYKSLEDALEYSSVVEELRSEPVPVEPQIPDNEESFNMFLNGLGYNLNCIKPTIVKALHGEIDSNPKEPNGNESNSYTSKLIEVASNVKALQEKLEVLANADAKDVINQLLSNDDESVRIFYQYDKLYIEDDYLVGLQRYISFYRAIVYRLLNNVLAANGSCDYDIVIKLGKGEVKLLPIAVTKVEDLGDISPSLDIPGLGPNGIDNLVIKQYRYFYSVIKSEVDDLISYSNSFVQNKIDELFYDGFDTQFSSGVSNVLKQASYALINSNNEYRDKNPYLRNLISSPNVELKDGYVFRDNKPFLYRGYYVHVTGALVTDSGEWYSYLKPNDELGGSDI